jgi:tetratricopeptide (TPR) repeat protein
MNLIRTRLVIAVFACSTPLVAFGADQYWAYTYKGIEVTAEGTSGYARSIAHSLNRLDQALTAVLAEKNDTPRLPNLVYAVPGDMFTLLMGTKDDSAARYYARPFDSSTLINSSYKGDDRFWTLYYGFSGSVLNSAYSFRYPQWFISGLSEVFAASSMDHYKVTIGGFARGRVYTLMHNPLIPLKTMLTVKWDDPQFTSKEFQQLYAAEAWFLVHQIVIEKEHHSEFYQYFLRVDRGESEDAAFAESFNVSYEALENVFRNSLASGKIEIIKVSVPDADDAAEPRRLSEADAMGRLSVFAAEHTSQADTALKLSARALKVEPKNAEGQIGQARAQIREADYLAALRTGESLCTEGELSQTVAAACGTLFSSLSRAVAAKKASLDVDQGSLAARALQYYEKAVALNSDDIASWYGMANLVEDTHDVAYARSLVPKVEQVQVNFPRIGVFAGTVSNLYAMTGDFEKAVSYAVIWQKNALSSTDRAKASAYVSRLKDWIERKHISDGPIAPN